jgi:hypothetical protein
MHTMMLALLPAVLVAPIDGLAYMADWHLHACMQVTGDRAGDTYYYPSEEAQRLHKNDMRLRV